MSKPRVKTQVFNALCFTDFSLRKWTIEDLQAHKIQYVGYGVETCPETKKVHHQGWLYAHTDAKRSFKAWKKVFEELGLGKMHFEKMLGNFAQNEKYIAKEGCLIEVGDKPMGNGKKRSLMEYKTRIEEGESVLDIAGDFEKFGTFLQYRSGLNAYAEHQRWKLLRTNREKPEVYIRIEPPGTGKTRWLDEQFGLDKWIEAPDNTGKWFDGCELSDVLVFNDVGYGCIPPLDIFKKLTDRYLCKVVCVGGEQRDGLFLRETRTSPVASPTPLTPSPLSLSILRRTMSYRQRACVAWGPNVAECCRVLQSVGECGRVLHRSAACCSAWHGDEAIQTNECCHVYRSSFAIACFNEILSVFECVYVCV